MSFSAGNSAPQIWEATLSQLLLRVTRQNYETWLRSTVGLRYEGTTLVVAAANDLACDWLSTRMKAVISQALITVAGPGLHVKFEPVAVAARSDSQALQPPLLSNNPTLLNPRFNFSTFLPAAFNEMALNAAQDIASKEQCDYSPLFITGGRGSGKTHLLYAIAQEAAFSGRRTLLVNAEQFLSEYTTAIRGRNGASFRARYRDLDLLLVDDIQVLAGKKATLTEFYQTVAGLHDQGRRVAVAGDPSAMNGEAERFQHLLQWGLVATIETPSIEDRIRFVSQRASHQALDLPEEVKHYIALRIRSSIRDLEGAVNRVAALARISQEAITIDFVAKALQPISTPPLTIEPCFQPNDVLKAVCLHLNLKVEELATTRRDRTLTYARHLAMYVMRQDLGLTYSAIAAMFGKKDHSTVVHACSQIHKQLSLSPALRADIDAARVSLRSSTPAA